MKTAISIPDPVFEAAEEAARRLSMSRSELYTKAVAEYVAKNCRGDVTKKLNEVYGDVPSRLGPAVAEMQRLSIEQSPW